MSTIRLSNYIKDTVIARLMKHAFEEREKALKAEEYGIGDAVYKDVYSAAVRRKMDDMPKGFLLEDDDLKVQFEGNSFTHIHFGERRRIAQSHKYNAAKVYDSKHPLTERYREWKKRESALKNEKRTTKSNARAVLDSVSTLKKLIEVWPEVEQFVEDFKPSATGKAQLPALPLKDLNRSLGLNKGKAA